MELSDLLMFAIGVGLFAVIGALITGLDRV